MNQRLTMEEKGIANLEEPPRATRVIVPNFDKAELIHNHELMLLRRITNPKTQKMWALLPFLEDN